MKKFFVLLFVVVITAAVMAQEQQSSFAYDGDKSVTVGRNFSCPPGTVFSQIPGIYDNGYYCQDGHPFFLAATNYTVSGPFGNFRFWGQDVFGCTLAATEEFEVIIWDGDPSDDGNIIFQETLNGVTTDTGESIFGSAIYQIDIDLGTTITQLSGYIGITRNEPSCSSGFGWGADDSGSGHRLSYDGTLWYSGTDDLFFCLSSDEPVSVPISNWAFYLGILLMISFVIIRFRRII